ncbi:MULTISPECIES: FtsW/RodA/SpoVE family cell cycle protein [Synechocystis]|uniref:Probable peptidoglycan glycosyltransferase FtsW n=1 Tax=Synechocystis salina LEGE 00031 TaxID=1828736 RepID=A0ABR9VU48_9SYNC|nr:MULTISPECIES: FtsW/RodA/SpoVE family cell cycle protein [Synechocystis]MBE9197340.1 FtsW/RodA/SpoVE family cell cycle protein [Synechocystis sp. LEGE 06083]MBE9240500.1 FtsW/RodA/SpoVE family cell cycle protein [Synechocystis salina LEGE 00041]MBE9253746.1 FtsW/RodA/SpoVE family cell cycle protein [Synechocystis salina LEGE 00031]
MITAANLIRIIFPFYDPEVLRWSGEARLMRTLFFAWIAIGVVVLFSASYAESLDTSGTGLSIILKQIAYLWLGLNIFNFLVRLPLQVCLKLVPWFLVVVLLLIFLTKSGLGVEVNGARRWISLGPILIQPSEFMKPCLVLQAANLFGNWHRFPWRSRLIWLGIFGLTLGSILLQPNLSTTALCGMGLWLIALASGLPWGYLISTALLGIITAVTSISIRDYQRARVTSFLDPFADPRGDGYQLVQSLYAIASGGILGRGFGMSQQKLFYLPIQTTDFIFAVFAEEFGLVGCVAFLLFLGLFATMGLRVAMRCRHRVKRLIGLGVVIFLVGQSLLNIGVASGALPTTGLPLPFFSYGGSSCLSSLVLAGLLVRVARESNEAEVIPLTTKTAPAV